MGGPQVVREGRFASLIVLDPALEAALPAVVLGTARDARWTPFRAMTPSPAELRRALWADVVVQLGVLDRLSGHVTGLVRCTGLDALDGWASLSWWLDPAELDAPARWEAIWLLIDEVFTCFPLRKLYLDVVASEPGACDLSRLPGARLEGWFREDRWIDGRWHDRCRFAVLRDGWVEAATWRRTHGETAAAAVGIDDDERFLAALLSRPDARGMRPTSLVLDPLDEIALDAVLSAVTGGGPHRQSGLSVAELRAWVAEGG